MANFSPDITYRHDKTTDKSAICKRTESTKRSTFQNVLLLVALLTFATVGADDDDRENYEPADGICTKCNCTSVNETLENGENGQLFTLDCSMKSHERLFADWPEEMGANHTGNLLN